MTETGSNLVDTLVRTRAQVSPPAPVTRSQPARVTTSKSTRLSACLRDARARAEEILRKHPRRDGQTGPTCQLCLVDYPCDAVRAAEDVLAISAKLPVGQPLPSKALLELMTELIDLGATDAAR